MKTLSTEQTERLLERDEAVVINVLPTEEFEKSHIPDTHNVPVDDDDFVDRVLELVGDEDAPVAVYCAGPECDASPNAARELEEAGFSRVFHYDGGMKAWLGSGNEVERAGETTPVH